MDLTKEYIKQCEMAEKIQEAWQPTHLDIFHYSNGISHVSLEDRYKCIKRKGTYFKRQKVWLPRQDQLQEMVDLKTGSDFSYALIEMHEPFMDGMKDYYYDMPSMEQLWLSYVMKELYSKQWSPDKKEWVKV